MAPIPPPVNGHSLASEVILGHLRKEDDVVVADLSIGSKGDGSVTRMRIFEVIKVLVLIWQHRSQNNSIYLTISESFAGNVKDLLIYLICAKHLHKTYIHLHGGSIKRLLFDHHPLLYRLNAFAIRQMAGVIISGRSHESIFSNMISSSKIHVIPNFAEDYLFLNGEAITEKFRNKEILRVLFISRMTIDKGYNDLLDAYLALDDISKRSIQIDFAGMFEAEKERIEFNKKIADIPNITYHGVVDNETKKSLFTNAHVFCLPTAFLEGQPISILEAYASGSVVVTTGQDGIKDVFIDGVNGYEIEVKSPLSIVSAFLQILKASEKLESIAQYNLQIAIVEYRADIFSERVIKLISSAYNKN
jgi:glycosyltransferase involved in cell wall biosynthesis